MWLRQLCKIMTSALVKKTSLQIKTGPAEKSGRRKTLARVPAVSLQENADRWRKLQCEGNRAFNRLLREGSLRDTMLKARQGDAAAHQTLIVAGMSFLIVHILKFTPDCHVIDQSSIVKNFINSAEFSDLMQDSIVMLGQRLHYQINIKPDAERRVFADICKGAAHSAIAKSRGFYSLQEFYFFLKLDEYIRRYEAISGRKPRREVLERALYIYRARRKRLFLEKHGDVSTLKKLRRYLSYLTDVSIQRYSAIIYQDPAPETRCFSAPQQLAAPNSVSAPPGKWKEVAAQWQRLPNPSFFRLHHSYGYVPSRPILIDRAIMACPSEAMERLKARLLPLIYRQRIAEGGVR